MNLGESRFKAKEVNLYNKKYNKKDISIAIPRYFYHTLLESLQSSSQDSHFVTIIAGHFTLFIFLFILNVCV